MYQCVRIYATLCVDIDSSSDVSSLPPEQATPSPTFHAHSSASSVARKNCTVQTDIRCWVCCGSSASTPCSFCERWVCDGCLRQCDECMGVFCNFCTTNNYEQRFDRIFCLNCNEDELQKRKGLAAGASTSSSHYISMSVS